MRRTSLVVGLVSGALLLPATPASAHVMTCRNSQGDAQARAARFLDYLKRQYFKAIEQFDQVNEPDRFGGALGGCKSGRARTFYARSQGGKRVEHRHPVLEYKYSVTHERVQLGTQTTNVYTVRLKFTKTKAGKDFLSIVILRPADAGGGVARGGEEDPPPLIPDIEPLL